MELKEVLNILFFMNNENFTRRDKEKLIAVHETFLEYNTEEDIKEIRSPKEAYDFLKPKFIGNEQEEFHEIFLNAKNRIIHTEMVFKGSTNTCIVDLKCLYSRALKCSASALEKQILIGKHISLLDEKIESNERLSNYLEEYGRLLFHKWFIDFNFPNDNGESDKDNNGEMVSVDGKQIPKDWSRVSLSEFIERTSNGDWGQEESFEGAEGTYCIRGADMPNIAQGKISNTPLRYVKGSKDRKKELKHGNIVIEASGGSPTQSTGRSVLIRDSILDRLDKPLYFSNFSKVIIPKENYSMFIFYLLDNFYHTGLFFHHEGKTSGLKNLLLNNMLNMVKFASPNIKLLKMFEIETGILSDRIFNLGYENELLEEKRNLLIHKLIQ